MDEYKAAQQQLAARLMQEQQASSSAPAPHQPQPPARPTPPPLPPRENSSYRPRPSKSEEENISSRPSYTDAPPSYHLQERGRSRTISEQWQSHDPRSSSMQSLRPAESYHGRRTLLLIYIHGFMGNETSFQSFPAHLHNLLTMSLQESHLVHTKIYPRYKSRRAIEFARDDFSKWLEPHENAETDVVLLGHSMGGILAAEVALQPPQGHNSSPPFKHHILGTINFDTPFLGMHPGLVGSGIASLFRPAPPPPGSVAQNASAGNSVASLASPGTPGTMTSDSASDYASLAPTVSSTSSIVGNDPYYNPPFPNDIHIKERTGLNKFLHFVNKHSDDFTTATKSYFTSHIEFGGCLADYPGLKKRYARIRELEDVEDTTEDAIEHDVRRIRFVNYYTASTGILKTTKIKNVSVKGPDGKMLPFSESTSQLHVNNHSRERTSEDSGTNTPRLSLEEHREGEVIPKRVRVDTLSASSFGGPADEAENDAVPAMRAVKQQIENLGEASGVRSAETPDDELAPMQMVDAMPIMSDEEDEHDHSENDYHDAQDEPTAAQSDAPFQTETTTTGAVLLYAPDRAAPPIPSDNTITRASLEEPSTPLIIRTPPTEPAFPPLPSVPAEPAPFDATQYEDKDARKIAEKDYKRLVKQYHAAVKDRESAIKDREKLRLRREKQAKDEAEKLRKAEEKLRLADEKAKAKEAEKARKEEDKERAKASAKSQKSGEELRLEQEAERMEAEAARMRGEVHKPAKLQKSRTPSPSPSTPSLAPTTSNVSQAPSTSTTATREDKPPKPKKDRRFCLLPNDLTRGKERDKCWVRVYMEGVDEVGAHCGLFFQGQQYESLVGDVGERIAGWVKDEGTRRMVKEFRAVD